MVLGIGATIAVFSVVNGVLLSPLPVRDEHRIAQIFESEKRKPRDSVSMADALDWKRRLESFESLAIYRLNISNMDGGGQPTLVRTIECDPDLFKVLGIKAQRGRNFYAADSQAGQESAAILSRAFWLNHFGGRDVLGRSFRLDDKLYIVVGVLGGDLNIFGPRNIDLWVPLSFDLHKQQNFRGFHTYAAVGRLKKGVLLEQANAELRQTARQLAVAYPAQNSGVGAFAMPLREWVSGNLRVPLILLLCAVISVLLIGCGNVANLLLARSTARAGEMSVRLAMGAQRIRLFQQLMTESLLLAFSAAAAGIGLAAGAIQIVKHLPNSVLVRPEEITLDWRVLVFSTLISAATGLVFGLIPALRASAMDINEALKQAGARVTESRRQQLLRRVLISLETAITTLLLIESVLLMQSFEKAAKLNPGFRPDHLMTMYASLPPERYGQNSADGARFADNVLARVMTLQGVKAAAFAGDLPFVSGMGGAAVTIQGKAAPKNIWEMPLMTHTAVTSGYCRTFGIPILKGRDLNSKDDAEHAQAVLVNEAFVETFLPGENPIGRRISYRSDSVDWHEIVGVVGNVRQQEIEKGIAPQAFVPFYRSVERWPALAVRTEGDPMRYSQALQEDIHKVDPEVPVFRALTMEQIMKEELGFRAFHTSLLTIFAGIALVLSAIGIYAVLTYSVTQRTAEIGLRMACGADSKTVLWMIVRQGITPAVIGALTGSVCAVWAAKILSQLLFEVKSTNWTAYAASVIFLVAVATAACYFPARRAASIDPLVALRYE